MNGRLWHNNGAGRVGKVQGPQCKGPRVTGKNLTDCRLWAVLAEKCVWRPGFVRTRCGVPSVSLTVMKEREGGKGRKVLRRVRKGSEWEEREDVKG